MSWTDHEGRFVIRGLPGRKFFVAAELFTVGCGELPRARLAAGGIPLQTVSANCVSRFREVDLRTAAVPSALTVARIRLTITP